MAPLRPLDLSRLAEGIVPDDPSAASWIHRRLGWISAIDWASMTVTVVFDETPIPNIPCMSTYSPRVGEGVWVDFKDNNPLAIGGNSAVLARPGDGVILQTYTTQMVPSNVNTPGFETVTALRDHGNYHATGSNTVIIPPGYSGWYSLGASAAWSMGSLTGLIGVGYRVNASDNILDRRNSQIYTGDGHSRASPYTELPLNAGDTVKLLLYQSGGAPAACTAQQLSINLIRLT